MLIALRKNDTLGLYTHLTHAMETTCPEHSIFVTSDKDLLKQTTLQTLRLFKFRGQILHPAEAVAYLSTLIAIVNVISDPKRFGN